MPRRHYSPGQIVTKLRQAEIDLATSPATITKVKLTLSTLGQQPTRPR